MTTLPTARLVLRPWRFSDVEAVYRNGVHPDFGRYIAIPRPYEMRHAEEIVARVVLRDREAHPTWAITLGGGYIGDVNVRVEPAERRAEMGYGIHPDHWGMGYTAEAAHAAMAWCFETFDLMKFSARADIRNTGSWRVMEKLGMRREGLLRSHRYIHGERSDEVVYGILREELQPTPG
ncbi:MAG: GNAT family N-acetyltransferase [Dehalococcoidia bacterium]